MKTLTLLILLSFNDTTHGDTIKIKLINGVYATYYKKKSELLPIEIKNVWSEEFIDEKFYKITTE